MTNCTCQPLTRRQIQILDHLARGNLADELVREFLNGAAGGGGVCHLGDFRWGARVGLQMESHWLDRWQVEGYRSSPLLKE